MKRITGTIYNLLEFSLGDYTTYDSALEVCGVQSVVQMLAKYLTRPEEESE
jgi:hypothetical protein